MSNLVLIVDDDVDTCETIALGLRRRDYETHAVHEAEAALDWIRDHDPDAVLCDVGLGQDDGIELCEKIVARRPDLPVVIVTGQGGFDTAVAAIRAGAYDFVTKPVRIEQLQLILDRSIEYLELRREVRRLKEVVDVGRTSNGLIGESRVMKRVYDFIARLGDGDSSVLVTGESGTGKELVARAIHERSNRDGRFVAINCAAMPASLLESELFGHVKGAFTDAKRDRQGLFVQAEGGTLFLDEIGEMPAEMQAKLLRVLQEHRVRPVGGDTEIEFDTRIISATNRDLEEEVAEGRFREDLYYRINVIGIDVPPLRSRGGDILLLAQNFVRRYATKFDKAVEGIGTEAARALRDYNWPGNVRELENCIERAVTLTRYSQISVEDLPNSVQSFKPRSMVIEGDDPESLPSLTEMEERYIRRVLEAVDWNKSRAARILRVDRRTLYRKMERLEIAESDAD
jgi:two-component system response regulator HydG